MKPNRTLLAAAGKKRYAAASGAELSFQADGSPLKSLEVEINPVQEGSGDPSPANLRPIHGWTGAEVSIAPAPGTGETETHVLSWRQEAGTVYGGSLDVTGGTLRVTHGEIAAYAGEPLPGAWISDRDVYAAGTSPSAGAQVVYALASPVACPLEPAEVRAFPGENHIWADTGDVAAEYRVHGDARRSRLALLLRGRRGGGA